MANNGMARGGAMQSLTDQRMLEAARQIPMDLRKFIARKALRSQVVQKQKNFYSAVRFPFTVTPVGAGPAPTQWTYTLERKKVVAFSYGANDDMVSAGFPKSYSATEADTNLVSKGDTGGANVEIHGVSLHLDELSDARLAKYIWSRTFVDITLDGQNRYALLGRLGRIPSPGGLYGAGESRVSTPPLGMSTGTVGVLTNGMPQTSNYFRLAEKIVWKPSSQNDSKFQVRFEVTRDISFTVSARPESPGIAAFTPPTQYGDEGTFVDVVVYLHTREIMPRSMQP